MAVETQVVWQFEASFPEVNEMGDVTLADLQTQPKESSRDPSSNNLTVYRYWVDMPAAENWVTYVQGFNPVSATIINP